MCPPLRSLGQSPSSPGVVLGSEKFLLGGARGVPSLDREGGPVPSTALSLWLRMNVLSLGPPSTIFTWKHIQLTLEKHGFQVSGSTYMQVFFNNYVVGPISLDSEFVDSANHEGKGGCLCVVYDIFYKGMEPLQILVSPGGPGTNFPLILRNCI